MKVILAGIEYVGTTTMANKLRDWKTEVTGEPFAGGLIHDHSKIPHTSGHPDDTTLEEQQQILALSPKLKEMYHRYSIYYHIHHYFGADDLTVGMHIEESIYARKYYGYGLPGAPFDREATFGQMESRIKTVTDDPIITVHMAADVAVIEQRMDALKDSPQHTNSPLLKADIPEIMAEYKRLVEKSDIGPKLHVNTSVDTPDETLAKIVKQMEPHFTDYDRAAIAAHSAA